MCVLEGYLHMQMTSNNVTKKCKEDVMERTNNATRKHKFNDHNVKLNFCFVLRESTKN